MSSVLKVSNLSVSFESHKKKIHAVQNATFQLFEKETVGIVGESGCGKSVLVQSLLKLIPSPPGKIENGTAVFEGADLLSLSRNEISKVRGRKIGMIFQDPFTSLNPTMKIGHQIMEPMLAHCLYPKKEAKEKTLELLDWVGITEPRVRFFQYPHELSGGMRQRVMIAISLACSPKILIADEPTTALDVTIQAQILELFKMIKEKTGTSILLITHDLGVVSSICDRVLVMYAGKIIESGSVVQVLRSPMHPYTRMLMDSLFRLNETDRALPFGSPPLLSSLSKGCDFAPRCPHAMNICAKRFPPLCYHHQQSARCWIHQKEHYAPASCESRKPQEILSSQE
jgi:oligopeptide/dipeptide ABC transporter ATP-binding protein